MQVVICTGSAPQAAEIRNTIKAVIKKDKMTICYTSRTDTYVVRTQNGPKAETYVYLLPDWDAAEHMQNLETLREKLVKKLSLTDSQVICAAKFP